MRRACELILPTVVCIALLTLGADPAAAQYRQKNLVADVTGHARFADPNLINPWGMQPYPGGGFIMSDSFAGVATVYGPNGKMLRPPINIPPAPGSPAGTPGLPAGLAANHTSEFVITKNHKSAPALFLFATLDGLICGWNPEIDPDNAIIIIDNSAKTPFPAAYTDLIIGRNKYEQTVLYATDSGNSPTASNNDVEIYNGHFHMIGKFSDPFIPSDQTLYSVREIGGKLYVTSAGFTPDDGGVVDIFDTEGNRIRRFAANTPGGPLEAPWEMVVAQEDFGPFGGALLIGNVDSGRITAFDLKTGKFLGNLESKPGTPLEIAGIWGMVFSSKDKDDDDGPIRLYFASGPSFPPNTGEYSDGLFGYITAKGEDDDSREGSQHSWARPKNTYKKQGAGVVAEGIDRAHP